jgi:hypothetical protein
LAACLCWHYWLAKIDMLAGIANNDGWLCCLVYCAGFAEWLAELVLLSGCICWLRWLPGYVGYAFYAGRLATLDMLAVADYAGYNIWLVISTVLARLLLWQSGYAGRPAGYSGWFSWLFRLAMQSMLPGYPGWINWQIWLAVLAMMFG